MYWHLRVYMCSIESMTLKKHACCRLCELCQMVKPAQWCDCLFKNVLYLWLEHWTEDSKRPSSGEHSFCWVWILQIACCLWKPDYWMVELSVWFISVLVWLWIELFGIQQSTATSSNLGFQSFAVPPKQYFATTTTSFLVFIMHIHVKNTVRKHYW